MKADQVILTKSFNFDTKINSGESLILTTKFIANGDPGGVFMNQELTLCSYCNSASFNLCGITLSPEKLRELANQLESGRIEAEAKCK